MTTQRHVGRILEIFRFYQAAGVNAAVGFGLFALFVYLGMNLYVAQISAHVLGVIFNYFSYSRHVFREATPAKFRFLIAYSVNYLVGLVVLFVVIKFINSPYVAGLITLFIASLINYVVLKYAVFVRQPS